MSLGAAALAISAQAQSTVLSTYTGWYDNTGSHDANNMNYLAGADRSGTVIENDFFVFNLSSVPIGTLTGATLSIFNPMYNSPNASETFQVGAVSTPISTLEAPATGATNIYHDLAAGTVYGSQTVTAASDGQYVNVTLNSAFLSAIQPLLGSGQIAIGGYLTGVFTTSPERFIFGSSVGGGTSAKLILTAVPEPTTLTLTGLGAASLLVFRRRK